MGTIARTTTNYPTTERKDSYLRNKTENIDNTKKTVTHELNIE